MIGKYWGEVLRAGAFLDVDCNNTPQNASTLKTSPIFSSPRPITFYTGTAVAVAARALWVGGPLCDLHETLSLLPPDSPARGTCPLTRNRRIVYLTIDCGQQISADNCEVAFVAEQVVNGHSHHQFSFSQTAAAASVTHYTALLTTAAQTFATLRMIIRITFLRKTHK